MEPAAIPGPQPLERDLGRVASVIRVADALGKYYSDNHAFPSTGINTQTLCQYDTIDAGCSLMKYLGEMPGDRLPDSSYPYRYKSDSQSYTIWAQLETTRPQTACPNTDESGLSDADHVYCLSGVAPR